MLNKEEKIYEVALGMIPGIGGILSRQLVSYSGNAQNVFQLSKQKLLAIPEIGEKLAAYILNQNVLAEAEKEVNRANEAHVQLLFYTDAAYPSRLKTINDAPPLLYYQGNTDLNAPKIVSIVGTRQASEYGKKITEEMITALVPYQPLIVSGLAYGIDIAAHKSALKSQLPTIGVMASGIDIIYPAVHESVAKTMLTNGGILTENAFGTKPDAPRFPARNRIIAGMADIIIVVEAAEKGGALITAEIAHSYDKEVFAVPGPINHTYSQGCNKLIYQNKARIYTQINDVIETLNWDLKPKAATKTEPLDTTHLTEEEISVVRVLQQDGTLQIDELSWKSGIGINKIASLLLNLEFAGIVKALPGKKFKLS
jgi:DNA processing protein